MSHMFLAEDGSLPSPEHLDQIVPLDKEAANYLWDFENKVGLTAFPPGSKKYFEHGEELSFGEGAQQKVKKWLFNRGLPFSTACFLCFQPDTAFMLTWKMIVHYSATLFFGHDVVAWDRSLNWALYYHHDDVFHFAKDRIYNGQDDQLMITQLLQRIEASKGKARA